MTTEEVLLPVVLPQENITENATATSAPVTELPETGAAQSEEIQNATTLPAEEIIIEPEEEQVVENESFTYQVLYDNERRQLI